MHTPTSQAHSSQGWVTPRLLTSIAIALVTASSNSTSGADDSAEFEFQPNDRIVMLGGTLIEREQVYGHWEAMLTAANADKNLTFRNLGWSADTVWAESRGIFDPPAEGYKRMIEQVKGLKPTVIIFHYGNNEADNGVAGIPDFIKQYEQLLDDLLPINARSLILLPLKQDEMPAPLPDPTECNKTLVDYSKAIQQMADERDIRTLDINEIHTYRHFTQPTGPSLTVDGKQLTDEGYRLSAATLRNALGQTDGTYLVGHDEEYESLRQAIIAKNQLYFHRWRPQNVTYLFLFRKHEQGNNAVEIPQFDPLVEQAEEEIHKLAQPFNTDN